MLNLMRKHAGSWMIKVILFVIVAVFSLWGVGNFTNRQVNKVAEVNGEVISRSAYISAYNQLVDNYRRVYNESMMQMLRPGEQALNQLIDRILVLQEAERMDLSVSDEEVAETITQMPAFFENGKFTKERYLRVLAQNQISHEEFAQSYKQDLLIDKLSQMIMRGVTASEEEALASYQFNNAEVSLEYLLIDPSRFIDIQLSEDEVAAYFKENENIYRTEPQIKVRYLKFDPDAYRQQVPVSDEAVADYYKSHPEEFRTEKTVEARHILVKVAADADDAMTEKKKKQATSIYQLAQSGQDFSNLAAKHSEGPSKNQGGNLGAFTRDAMVKPFADKAFSMKAGEISEPVRTKFGWHVIKVDKINAAATKSLDSVKPDIRRKLVTTEARKLASDKVNDIYNSVFDGDDLTDAGEINQVPVMTTEFFSAKGVQERGIDDPQQFTRIAFGLQRMLDISEIVTLGDSFYLLQVFERRESKIPELQAVSKKVRDDLLRVKQNEKAKAEAQSMLEKIKQGTAMAEAGADAGIQPATTGFFKRNGTIPKIGFEAPLSTMAFQLTKKAPLPNQVVEGKQGWYVIQLSERKLPSTDGFEKEKTSTVQRITTEKKRTTLQRWLADLKSRSAVEIYQEQVVTP